jgi:arabinogalactan endo-1,4-beta-galactosidase
LVAQVRAYTKQVILELVAQGTVPYQVDIGNEITNGMMWPDGQLYCGNDYAADWQRFTDLIKAGIAGVRAAQGANSIKIGIHIDRGGDNAGAEYFFDQLAAYGVNYDVICLSYYVWWHGPIDSMVSNIQSLATKYGKDLVIAETMYPFALGADSSWWVYQASEIDSRFPPNDAGQASYLTSLESVIQSVPGGHGRGLLYWAPEVINAPDTQGFYNLGLFDYSNEALPGINAVGALVGVSQKNVAVYGGFPTTLTAFLPCAPLLSNCIIDLTSANSLVSVPSSISVAQGTNTTRFTLRTGVVARRTSVTINLWNAGRATEVHVTLLPLSGLFTAF